MPSVAKRRLLLVIMDGVGARSERFGNAVEVARTPQLDHLRQTALYREIAAHGRAVGLASDKDIGNSEVGHNALGAGRIFDQGSKLVDQAIQDGRLFRSDAWQGLCQQVKAAGSTMHFLGLLSDGNVHSHERHLHSMLRQAKSDGVGKVRVHILLDGRDVEDFSAETYIDRLEGVLAELHSSDFDVRIASGGGRMHVTMDRYEADWSIVERGWQAHVLGAAERFPSAGEAIRKMREQDPGVSDQNLNSFAIADENGPVGPICDGDAVILFNFRGDRAIEMTQALTDPNFSKFPRSNPPQIAFAGMMQYDGDLNIPETFLVAPPEISGTLTEHLVRHKVQQFACSETQKFGHVTYFWNGNRSGKVSPELETYVEISSDQGISFDQRPWMKADEITVATVSGLADFDFGRINFANGDMVGHTGNFEASVIAVETVDLMIGRLVEACRRSNTLLMITADHGNCDQMFEGKPSDFADWETAPLDQRPKAKTAHTLSPVPLYIFDPTGSHFQWEEVAEAGLGHIAATTTTLMGIEPAETFLPSLVKPL